MKRSFLFFIMLLHYSLSVSSQIVNMGELTVIDNTIISSLLDFNNTNQGTLINDGDMYIYSNFNNDGMVDFNGITGLTRFLGSTPKIISGNKTSYLYNVLFSNKASHDAFQLSGALSISNESQFNLGIVDNDNYGGDFRFEQFGNPINVSDASHVNGAVIKVGDNDFNYPIGNGNYYRMASISSPEKDSDSFTTKYFFEQTNTKYPINQLEPSLSLINNSEYWSIERNNGTANIMLTLTWNANVTPSEIIADPLEIHIVRWDTESQQWVDKGGVVDINNQSVTTAIEEYGVFTLAKVKEQVNSCSLIVYNVITPNQDGSHEYLKMETESEDDSCLSSIAIKIFNRWGVKVYESNDYGIDGDFFRGKSQSNLLYEKKEDLPGGTYFYLMTINYYNNQGVLDFYTESNYLYINTD